MGSEDTLGCEGVAPSMRPVYLEDPGLGLPTALVQLLRADPCS